MAFVPFIVTVMFMAQMAQNPVGLEPIIFLSSQECVLERVPRGDAALLIFLTKNTCLAVQLEAKQA